MLELRQHDHRFLALAVAAFAAANLSLGLSLGAGKIGFAVVVALLPLLIATVPRLIVANRHLLVFTALFVAVIAGTYNRLPNFGGITLYTSDIFVGLAVAGYLVSLLNERPEGRPRWPRTPVLSWPFALFAGAMALGIVRGHLRYGTPYLSQPARMVAYAAIAAAIAGQSPRTVYRGIVGVFYAATVVQALEGAYFLASGSSQTASSDLSTGGVRALGLSTAMYLSGGLVLALLNLELDGARRRRILHFSIAGLATFGIVISLGRTTFAAVGIVLPVLLLSLRHARRMLLTYLPLLVPVLALAVALSMLVMPSLGTTLQERLTGRLDNDTALVQRENKYRAALEGLDREPALGLGFGRTVDFTSIDGTVMSFNGDPENSYVYLLAGAGWLGLGSLALLMLTFFVDAFRRVRRASGEARALIVFAGSLAFVFFVNALTGPILATPRFMLTIWILMLLPALAGDRVVERAPQRASARWVVT